MNCNIQFKILLWSILKVSGLDSVSTVNISEDANFANNFLQIQFK